MNRYLKNMVVFLLVSIMAVSCSSKKAVIPEEFKNPEPTETSVPIPTDTPEPTQTPEPTAVPTNTPDPDFVGCVHKDVTSGVWVCDDPTNEWLCKRNPIETPGVTAYKNHICEKVDEKTCYVYNTKNEDKSIIKIEKLEEKTDTNILLISDKFAEYKVEVSKGALMSIQQIEEEEYYTDKMDMGFLFSPDTLEIVDIEDRGQRDSTRNCGYIINKNFTKSGKLQVYQQGEWCSASCLFTLTQLPPEYEEYYIKCFEVDINGKTSYWGWNIRDELVCPQMILLEQKPHTD